MDRPVSHRGMYFIVLFALTLALSLPFLLHYICVCLGKPRKPPEGLTLTTRDDIHGLLDPPGTSVAMLLRHRALPNARLLSAFGIKNSTFTSPSVEIHQVFNKRARARLRSLEPPNRWETMNKVIVRAVEFYLPEDPIPTNYATYIQAVVFTTVFAAFFESTGPLPAASEVRVVTEGINTLWMASKHATFSLAASPILPQINKILQAWLSRDTDGSFHDNPLEILLPAYETLWRLVAHTFLYVEGSPEHTDAFVRFFDESSPMQFKASRDSETPSAHDILQEVLRIHPPTKRIKRISAAPPSWIHCIFTAAGFHPDSVCNNIVAADIEALQRSSVWGPSPHDFDAMRHKASTEAQRQCFMPFGLGPLKCIASSFAPRLAGMVVGGLAKREDVRLIRGERQGDREGWMDWKICRSELVEKVN